MVLIVVLHYNDKKMTNNQGIQQKISTLLKKAIEEGVFPGAAVGIVVPSQEQVFVCRGVTPYQPVSVNTIYDVASVTKSMITSTIALLFLEKGWFELSDRVQVYLGSENILIHHLLTHTLDFSLTLSELKSASAEQIIAAVQTVPLNSPPGSSYAYVNATSMLLGLELERIAALHGLPHNLFMLAQHFIFDPLALHTSWLGKVPNDHLERVAPTEIDPWRNGEVRGQVHDESAWKLLTDGTAPKYSGAAGLFTTAADVTMFLRAYMQGQIISKELLANCARDQRPALGTNHSSPIGLGWELEQRHWLGSKVSDQTIGKTGFTGSCVVMDLKNEFAVALLCNHSFPHRPSDRTKINQFRRQLLNTLVECIV